MMMAMITMMKKYIFLLAAVSVLVTDHDAVVVLALTPPTTPTTTSSQRGGGGGGGEVDATNNGSAPAHQQPKNHHHQRNHHHRHHRRWISSFQAQELHVQLDAMHKARVRVKDLDRYRRLELIHLANQIIIPRENDDSSWKHSSSSSSPASPLYNTQWRLALTNDPHILDTWQNQIRSMHWNFLTSSSNDADSSSDAGAGGVAHYTVTLGNGKGPGIPVQHRMPWRKQFVSSSSWESPSSSTLTHNDRHDHHRIVLSLDDDKAELHQDDVKEKNLLLYKSPVECLHDSVLIKLGLLDGTRKRRNGHATTTTTTTSSSTSTATTETIIETVYLNDHLWITKQHQVNALPENNDGGDDTSFLHVYIRE